MRWQSQQIFMLSAFVRCSSGAFYFYYSGQCPGPETESNCPLNPTPSPTLLSPLFLGLMKMKAATAAATCAYPPSNAQLKASSSIWSTRLMCRWCPLEGDPHHARHPQTHHPSRSAKGYCLRQYATSSPSPSASFSCRHRRLRSAVFLSTQGPRRTPNPNARPISPLLL